MTSIAHTDTGSAELRAGLEPLVEALRSCLDDGLDDREASARVAEQLRRHLPSPGILTAAELEGSPEHYVQHVLHVDEQKTFSIVALVWLPGQATPIHDHVSWCVVGVIQGDEHEARFEVDRSGQEPVLVQSATATNPIGSVCGFAPPGDIHYVRNAGDDTAVSIHVYGADISKLGSSVRRTYDMPVHEVA